MRPAERLDAHARALLVLATAFDSPLASAARALAREPRSLEIAVAGMPATLYTPAVGRRWPALVLLNGATERGRHHPRVIRLASALARAGHLVLVPDAPGVARGEVTAAAVEATVACALAAASWPEARRRRVAFLGISVGTTLALLAAEESSLAGRISMVSGLTGYTDLADLIRLATTGTYVQDGRVLAYAAEPFLSLCVARSVCTGLGDAPGKELLAAALNVAVDDPEPLAGLSRVEPSDLGREARAAHALLLNRDADRFDTLYAALPDAMRAAVDRLSPVSRAERLHAPVELLVDLNDKYFPLEQALALARASPRVRLTTTGVLAHADTRFSLRGVQDATGLVAFVARTLQAARFG